MKFAVFLMADSNYHIAGWRHPDAYVDAGSNIQRWIEFARIARARQARHAVRGRRHRRAGRAASAIACQLRIHHRQVRAVHLAGGVVESSPSSLGLVATSATAYNEPYLWRASLASLDHHHRRPGRLEFGHRRQRRGRGQLQPAGTMPPTATATSAARSSSMWSAGCGAATTAMHFRATRRRVAMSIPAKVHALNHKGKYFSVKGPLSAAGRRKAIRSSSRPERRSRRGNCPRAWPTWCSPRSRRSRTPRRSMRT